MKSQIQRLLYSILLYVYRFVGNLVRLVKPKQEVKTVVVYSYLTQSDLLVIRELGANTSDKMYWSRKPGKFINKITGKKINTKGYKFSCTVQEWYETLIETCIDVGNTTLDLSKPLYLVVSLDILTILECSILYRPALFEDHASEYESLQSGFRGVLCNRFKVYLDIEAVRNEVLVVLKVPGELLKVSKIEIKDMSVI